MLQGDIDDGFEMRLSTLKGALISLVFTSSKTMETESHSNAARRDLLLEPGKWNDVLPDARANHEIGTLFRTLRKPRDRSRSRGAEGGRDSGTERGARRRCT